MNTLSDSVEVAIIGAGAAGLAAARTLHERQVSCLLLEGSHRIGGRAYTEDLAPGMPFDLGCHWMHSASLNPFLPIAEALGFTYSTAGFARGLFLNGAWGDADQEAAWRAFRDANDARAEQAALGEDLSLWEVTERDSFWTPIYDYLTSLVTSADPDQISIQDLANYRDTYEDWPVEQGYGRLIAAFHQDTPVTLNNAVRAVDWSGKTIRLDTAKGQVEAKRLIVTVSTGILNGGDIRFTPTLPAWKLEAAAALPLGNHNRIALAFDRDVFGPDVPRDLFVLDGDSEAMGLGIRPFGHNYVTAVTGGRFADWLERAGIEAAADLARETLRKAFGSDIDKHVTRHLVTAWRTEPWVKGAYSSALPGQAGQREMLAEPIDSRLFFAGEACSREFYSTAHGAHLTGLAAAEAAMSAITAGKAGKADKADKAGT